MNYVSYRVILDGKTVGDYDSKWFSTFEQALEFIDNCEPGKHKVSIEVQVGDFYLAIDPTARIYRPLSQMPV